MTTSTSIFIRVSIKSGDSLSELANLVDYTLMALITPPDIDGATDVSFQASATPDGAFVNCHNEMGIEVSIKVAPNRATSLADKMLSMTPYRYIKIRLGKAGSPVTATADRVLTLVLKR